MRYLAITIYLIFSCAVSAETFTLYLIRHAEKDLTQKTDPNLTDKGRQTALKLKNFLSNQSLSSIYSTNYKRTLNTAKPISDLKKLSIKNYDPASLKTLAEQLIDKQQNALIVGHSNTTPELVGLLGGISNPIAEDEYGEVFILTIDSSNQSVETKSHLLKD